MAGIGSAIPFLNIDYSLFSDLHWVSAAIARRGTVQLLEDTGIFGGLSSGAAYIVGNYVSESQNKNLTLILCPDMGYRYSSALRNTAVEDTVVSEPLWIDSLDQLAPPWSALNWAGRDYDPVCQGIEKEGDANG